MRKKNPLDLGRRERQIMEAVYARGQASVSEVLGALSDPPSYSAVRAILNTLEEKGHLRRKKTGKKFLYLPIISREKARRSVLQNLIATFFNGSATQAMASLIEMDEERFSDEDLERLSQMIEDAKRGGR
jgi:BlaI family transcriptional regulator, penicillinase repressor